MGMENGLMAALRPILIELAGHSDEELLQGLAVCGITIDREFLERLTRNFPSFETMTIWLLKEQRVDLLPDGPDQLRIRASLIHLAQRWFPERLRFEQLDELIQQGLGNPAVLPEVWLRAWQTIVELRKKFRFDSLDDFDQCFQGTTSLREWLSLYLDWMERLPPRSPEQAVLKAALFPEALRMCRDSDGAFLELLPRLEAVNRE